MQPKPRAETSRLLFPSLRFCICFSFDVPSFALIHLASMRIACRPPTYLPVSLNFLPDSTRPQPIPSQRSSVRDGAEKGMGSDAVVGQTLNHGANNRRI